ncbi:unnamed protein product, partial [Polarella glacialis]
ANSHAHVLPFPFRQVLRSIHTSRRRGVAVFTQGMHSEDRSPRGQVASQARNTSHESTLGLHILLSMVLAAAVMGVLCGAGIVVPSESRRCPETGGEYTTCQAKQ